MYDDLVNVISKYEKKGSFTHSCVNDDLILRAEKKLNLSIPKEYKWFLKKYGHGGLDGIEIVGVGKNGRLIFVDYTSELREYGLSHNMIAIENCDEWIYCLDTVSHNVVMWVLKSETYEVVYNNFIDYLTDRINDAVENI